MLAAAQERPAVWVPAIWTVVSLVSVAGCWYPRFPVPVPRPVSIDWAANFKGECRKRWTVFSSFTSFLALQAFLSGPRSDRILKDQGPAAAPRVDRKLVGAPVLHLCVCCFRPSPKQEFRFSSSLVSLSGYAVGVPGYDHLVEGKRAEQRSIRSISQRGGLVDVGPGNGSAGDRLNRPASFRIALPARGKCTGPKSRHLDLPSCRMMDSYNAFFEYATSLGVKNVSTVFPPQNKA